MKPARNHRRLLLRISLTAVALVGIIQVAARVTRWTHNRKVAYLGDSLFVEAHGAGAPVLLLHGLRGSGTYWSGLVGSMASAPYRMIVPDLLGFGRSPWPLVDYSVEDHIEALRRSIRPELAGEPLIVVGHSMGSILAVEYARRHPEEVKALVLLNPPIFESEEEARGKIEEMSSMAAAFSLNRVLARASCDVLCAARPLFWHLAPMLESDVPAIVAKHAVLHRWESFNGSLQNVVLTARLGEGLRSIAGTPVVLIPGGSDPVTTAARVRNVASATGASVKVVSGGHNILLEHPAETARVVRDAIESSTPVNR
jgi:pimeloyl-ACP methyl ester carboxylesterase